MAGTARKGLSSILKFLRKGQEGPRGRRALRSDGRPCGHYGDRGARRSGSGAGAVAEFQSRVPHSAVRAQVRGKTQRDFGLGPVCGGVSVSGAGRAQDHDRIHAGQGAGSGAAQTQGGVRQGLEALGAVHQEQPRAAHRKREVNVALDQGDSQEFQAADDIQAVTGLYFGECAFRARKHGALQLFGGDL